MQHRTQPRLRWSRRRHRSDTWWTPPQHPTEAARRRAVTAGTREAIKRSRHQLNAAKGKERTTGSAYLGGTAKRKGKRKRAAGDVFIPIPPGPTDPNELSGPHHSRRDAAPRANRRRWSPASSASGAATGAQAQRPMASLEEPGVKHNPQRYCTWAREKPTNHGSTTSTSGQWTLDNIVPAIPQFDQAEQNSCSPADGQPPENHGSKIRRPKSISLPWTRCGSVVSKRSHIFRLLHM